MDRTARRALRIGEACRYLGITRSTLLHAEEAGDVQPYRTPGGHRRYDPAHLDELLARWAPEAPQRSAAVGDGQVTRASDLLGDGHHLQADLPETARWGLRRIVKLMEARAAGLWLRSEDPACQLRFCAGYRIPRWLTDRLRAQAPAEPLVPLLHGGGYRMLDTDDLDIPAEVTGGRSLAVVVTDPASPPLGVVAIFASDDHRWTPDELRILQNVAPLLATVITQRILIDDLERTLARVQNLCNESLPGPVRAPLAE